MFLPFGVAELITLAMMHIAGATTHF